MLLISLINGKKHCALIDNAEEYRKIRNSSLNLQHLEKARQGNEDEKRKLVQFNYSCLPNENGTLAGSKRLSNFVGMDVDFDKSAPDYEQKMAEAPNIIIGKAEELGLMMLERSVSKGYHVVFRRHKDMNQIENIEWASQLLGIKFDEGAKDCTRVFFTTSASEEDLIYLNDEIFDNSECICTVDDASSSKSSKGKKSVSTTVNKVEAKTEVKAEVKTEVKAEAKAEENAETKADEKAESKTAAEPTEEAMESSLNAFDACVKIAELPAELDKWGEHNWHNNLLAVLSTGLPKLVTKSQLIAVLKVRMPNYVKFNDCTTLVDSFYDNYKTQNTYMSKSLREINAKMQGNTVKNEEAKKSGASSAIILPPLPAKLPSIIELSISNYDKRYREMLAMSCLPILAAHASAYEAEMMTGEVVRPMEHVAVVGGSGQGKGNVTALYNDMTRNTIQKENLVEMEKVRANADERERMKNKKDCPSKYHAKLRTFETASKTSILELATNIGPSSMLLGFYSESDVIFKANQQTFSDLSVIFRKGWDGDLYTQYYISDSTCNTCVNLFISLLVCGTPNAILDRMFADTENGMMQRFIPVSTPKPIKSVIPPQRNLLTDEEKVERDALINQLYQKNKELGENVKRLDLSEVNEAIERWVKEVDQLYQSDAINDVEASLFHRCPLFFFRAAIPLVALYGKVTPEIIDFCEWVGRTAFYNICTLFAQRVANDMEKGKRLMNNIQADGRVTSLPILDELPNVFTTKQFNEARARRGLSTNSKCLVSHYCNRGYIERIERGKYQKKVMVSNP